MRVRNWGGRALRGRTPAELGWEVGCALRGRRDAQSGGLAFCLKPCPYNLAQWRDAAFVFRLGLAATALIPFQRRDDGGFEQVFDSLDGRARGLFA